MIQQPAPPIPPSRMSRHILFKTCVGIWLVVCFVALIGSGAGKMTAPPQALTLATDLSLAMAVVIFPAMVVGWLCLRRIWNLRICLALGVLACITCVGAVINICGYAPHANFWDPMWYSYSDSALTWQKALDIYYGRPLDSTSNGGYPHLIAWLLRIFPYGILTPIFFSVFCTVVSGAMIGLICSKALPSNKEGERRGFFGLLLFLLVPSVEWYGSLLMKETPLILGLALCIYPLMLAMRGAMKGRHLFPLLAGGILVLVLRNGFGLFIILGGAVALVTMLYYRRSRAGRYPVWPAVSLMIVGIAIVEGGGIYRYSNLDTVYGRQKVEQRNGQEFNPGEYMEDIMFCQDNMKRYHEVLGNYYQSPVASRLLRLPITASAMYFPPVPWNFMREREQGSFCWWPHLPLWYGVGALWLGYFVFCFARRRKSGLLTPLSIWTTLCWLGIAYSTAGTVARYWLPLLPAIIPMCVQTLACLREGLIARRQFYWYAGVYATLVGTGLAAIFILTH